MRLCAVARHRTIVIAAVCFAASNSAKLYTGSGHTKDIADKRLDEKARAPRRRIQQSSRLMKSGVSAWLRHEGG